jgi:hypothetical protein
MEILDLPLVPNCLSYYLPRYFWAKATAIFKEYLKMISAHNTETWMLIP